MSTVADDSVTQTKNLNVLLLASLHGWAFIISSDGTLAVDDDVIAKYCRTAFEILR